MLTSSQQQQQQQHAPLLLPVHPPHLVLPSNYLRQLNAIRLAGGSVVWIDLVTKVNKVKRQQQRLIIITQTHLYACLPDEGDIQRCLPLSGITAAHVHIPASACIGGPSSKRAKSMFGNLVNQGGGAPSSPLMGGGGSGGLASTYSGSSSPMLNVNSPSSGSALSSSSALSRTKCEVLLVCPQEYDLLFFVNDTTFQHFTRALQQPQDANFVTPSAQLAASFAFSSNGSNGGGNSFAGNSFGGNNGNGGQNNSSGGGGGYAVPIFEVPQPILQNTALMAKARLEKPPRYTRTKAARFVTCFTKLVAPPSMLDDVGNGRGNGDGDDNDTYDDEEDAQSVGSGGSVDYGSDATGGAHNTTKMDMSQSGGGGAVGRVGSSSPTPQHPSSSSGLAADASVLLDSKELKQRAARQRAISFHIPLPGADDLKAQAKKKQAAQIEETQSIAGRIALDSADEEEGDETVDAESPRGLATSSRSGNDFSIVGGDQTHGGNAEGKQKAANKDKKQKKATFNDDKKKLDLDDLDDEDDSSDDDLLKEMDLDQRNKRANSTAASSPAASAAASPNRNRKDGAAGDDDDEEGDVRWAVSSSPAGDKGSSVANNNKELSGGQQSKGDHFTDEIDTPPHSSACFDTSIDAAENGQTRNAEASSSSRAANRQQDFSCGSKEGWLAILKAHKGQNDALRRIIADLQVQVSSLREENAALKRGQQLQPQQQIANRDAIDDPNL